MAIEEGDTVHAEYTGTLENGEVFDTSEDREPLVFEIGGEEVLPKFEDAFVGKDEGDEFEIELEPQEAYGEVREDLVQQIPKEQFDEEVEEGMHLHLRGPEGQTLHGDVTDVGDAEVTVDLNHPLAGKKLNFEVEILTVEKA